MEQTLLMSAKGTREGCVGLGMPLYHGASWSVAARDPPALVIISPGWAWELALVALLVILQEPGLA